MARTNVMATVAGVETHEGAAAYAHLTTEQALRRSVMSCLLWEKEFYENGEEIAERIVQLAKAVPAPALAALAVEAREQMNLRHVPLLLVSVLADQHRGRSLVPATVARVIQRTDELPELLAIFAKMKGVGPDKLKKIMPQGLRKGIARAFGKFDAYQLGKYDRDSVIKLKDVLFLTHPKPKDAEQDKLWKELIAGTLKAPDTWEVSLSGGADKKETFERLIKEGKLGYLALLRNLRNMAEAKVDDAIVQGAILARKGGAHRVLPFRYVAAARAAPRYEPYLDVALGAAILDLPVLKGKTIILVDVSGSMDYTLSQKSDMTRMDAAAALASVINGDVRVFTFSDGVVEVPPRRGMAGVDAVVKSQVHSGTYLGRAIAKVKNEPHDRLIVITDEQSHDDVRFTKNAGKNYMINVASYQRGVGYGPQWVHLDGFSENVLRWIHEYESNVTEAV